MRAAKCLGAPPGFTICKEGGNRFLGAAIGDPDFVRRDALNTLHSHRQRTTNIQSLGAVFPQSAGLLNTMCNVPRVMHLCQVLPRELLGDALKEKYEADRGCLLETADIALDEFLPTSDVQLALPFKLGGQAITRSKPSPSSWATTASQARRMAFKGCCGAPGGTGGPGSTAATARR